ncbi:alkanesulfonate monooxygenase SsuD/methylene tetrahydromethanopterin reductase-like flavin-dependent oxidoreductase (luciferase family) [Rhodoligotrophos appendicifer]|uniref:LLM class flavin-dependent oxidoreductase n=1 Tax=Rhodoligotrophos appendicifer TaxID=987056 RepID=UPI00147878C5|nr:LLM class flavin-dependent oxidoreductase [Rhodoligotrophos appendicifer]
MKIGILLTSHPDAATEPYPHQTVHDRVTGEVMEAEEDGFDSVWIAEHHFSNTYGILPDPFAYLAYLAAKTSRIKLCAGVMVVPLHHPMRIVENAAFIDILSKGRFQLGLGSGYRPYEFDGLGVDYEERRAIQQEAIPLILDGFHKKRMMHQGKYFTIKIPEDREIFPQPIQRPHPPIYLGAGTDGSIIQAARNGFGLMQSSLPSAEVLGQHIDLYRRHMHEAPALLAQNPAFGQTDVVRMVYVAETDAKAREDSEEGIVRHMRSFLVGTGKYLGDVTEKSGADDFTYDKVVRNTILHGSPETVIRQIEDLAKVGVTSIMIHYPPYYGMQKTLKMLRFFAKEVLPHVSNIGAKVSTPIHQENRKIA